MGSNGTKLVIAAALALGMVGSRVEAKSLVPANAPPMPVPQPEPFCLDCGMLPAPPPIALPFTPTCSDCKTGSIPMRPPIAFFGPFFRPKPYIYVVPPRPTTLPKLAFAHGTVTPPLFGAAPVVTGTNVDRNAATRVAALPVGNSGALAAEPANAGFHH